MANEIAVSGAITYAKAGVTYPTGQDVRSVGEAISNFLVTVTGSAFNEGIVSLATSSTAIPLGGVTAPHWAFFQNLDATNYVQLRNGSSGTVFPRLYPGEWTIVPLDNACVPYGIANTAACLLKYLIVQY